jgi:hypothetical protein
MWRVFSMAAHPKRQLGSASGSILWLNALSWLCPERSLCRHIATFLFACWCHMMVPNLDLICMQLFLQVCWLRRRLVAQLALTIETISLGERLLLTLSPSWVLHSIAASLSALSFPSIPVWLGIHVSLVRLPFDLRLAIISRVAVTAWFSDREFDEMAVMAELESLYIWFLVGSSPCRKLV